MSGSRIPPRAFPYWSRSTMLKNGVVAIWLPDGGATPWVIHLCSATSAESSSSKTPMLSGWVAPGLDLDERRRVIGADEGRERRERDQPGADRRGEHPAADREEAVERMADRLDRVDVGDHPEGRLRVTRADHRRRVQAAKEVP